MFLNKVVDEIGSLLVFQLLIGDTHSVKQLLPIGRDVATLCVCVCVCEKYCSLGPMHCVPIQVHRDQSLELATF